MKEPATLTYAEFQRRLDEIDRDIARAERDERHAQVQFLFDMRQRLVEEWQQKPQS